MQLHALSSLPSPLIADPSSSGLLLLFQIPPRTSNAGYRAAEWGEMYVARHVPHRELQIKSAGERHGFERAFTSPSTPEQLPQPQRDAYPCEGPLEETAYAFPHRSEPMWRGRLRVIEKGSEIPTSCFINLEDANTGARLCLLAPPSPGLECQGGCASVTRASRCTRKKEADSGILARRSLLPSFRVTDRHPSSAPFAPPPPLPPRKTRHRRALCPVALQADESEPERRLRSRA